MRKLFYLITLSIVAASPLAFLNCEWPEETRLRGQVYDSVKQEMLGGVKVILWSCQKSFLSAGITHVEASWNPRGRVAMEGI